MHLRVISQEIPQPSITKTSLKIVYLKFHSNLPGANELKSSTISSRAQWVTNQAMNKWRQKAYDTNDITGLQWIVNVKTHFYPAALKGFGVLSYPERAGGRQGRQAPLTLSRPYFFTDNFQT